MPPRGGPTRAQAGPRFRSAATMKTKEAAGPKMPEHHLPALPTHPIPHHVSYFGVNFEGQPWIKRLNWLHVPLLTLTPLLTMYGMFTTTLQMKTLIWAIVYYAMTGLGITAGYHRLWAHKTYSANLLYRVILMLWGSGAVEGSIRWWSRDHRAHHRYVDTSKDPYAVTNGFFYAHVGWMLIKQDKSKIGRASIADLNEDPLVRFQHTYYLPLAILTGFVFPTVVAGYLWGDYRGGYFYAAVARLVFVHHSTFFVNSLAHYWGDETYTDGHTAKNSIITAVLTLGEGYHNYHHEFPSDYRNGIRFYHYDPTKWFIGGMSFLGMTYDLKQTTDNEIKKAKLQMEQRRLDTKMEGVYWGPDDSTLRTYTMNEVEEAVAVGEQLLVLDGYVLDLKSFRDEHPGGVAVIANHLGTDVTGKFWGETYKHSNAAHNLQRTMRCGILVSSSDTTGVPASGHAKAE